MGANFNSLLEDNNACGCNETRVSFKDFTLASSGIPDRSQAYIVDVGRNWFQDFGFSMEMNDYGVVGKAQAKTVEKAAEDVLSFGASLLSPMVGNVFEATKGHNIAMVDHPETEMNEALKLAFYDLDRLERRINDRSLLVASLDADSISRSAVAISQLNAEVAQLTTRFTGKRGEELEPSSISFIPSADSLGQDLDVYSFDRCGGSGADSKLKVRLDDALAAIVRSGLPGNEQKENDSPGAEIPESLINVGQNEVGGWPHRIPVLTVATVTVCSPAAKDNKDSQVAPAPVCKSERLGDVGIAQYGKVYRLPSRTGGRSSNIDVTYSALGSLSKIDIDQEGQSASPIYSTLASALARSPEPAPKEADRLAAEIALIKSRQELCRLIYGVSDERCMGASPPVE